MIDIEKLLNSSLIDMKRGYSEEQEYFECLLCGKQISKGIIYQEDGLLYEAGKYIQIHIQKKHGSVF